MKLGRMMMGQPMCLAISTRGLDVVSETQLGNLEPNVAHRLLEQFAILRGRDRLGTGADHLDTQAFGHARDAPTPSSS